MFEVTLVTPVYNPEFTSDKNPKEFLSDFLFFLMITLVIIQCMNTI